MIVCGFEVFFFDEFFFNFDVELCVDMWVEIVCLYKEIGVIMIYVIYDQVEVMILVDKIVVLCVGYIE